jgi:hypothetical protein
MSNKQTFVLLLARAIARREPQGPAPKTLILSSFIVYFINFAEYLLINNIMIYLLILKRHNSSNAGFNKNGYSPTHRRFLGNHASLIFNILEKSLLLLKISPLINVP